MKAIASISRKILYWKRLSRLQKKGKEELETLQKAKLTKIVKFAYNNVPFYRRAARELKLDTESMTFPKDLVRLPIVERRDIQEKTREMIAKGLNMDRLVSNRTSGSTGLPIKIYMDQKALDYNHALLLYCFWELGFRPWHKFINFTGVESDRQIWWRTIINLFRRNLSTGCNPTTNLKSLEREKPQFIYGFPSYIELLARELTRNQRCMKDVTVITHGETLYNWQRRSLCKAFSERIFNTYGCTECYLISFECDGQRGMHVITDAAYLEFLDDEGKPVDPGEEGNLVITLLNNFAMPLVRYKVGDIATRAEEEICPCGRTWPLLMKDVVGRRDDYFVDGRGRRISPKSLDHDAFYSPSIRQFQVIQEDTNRIEIMVVRGENFDPEAENSLKEAREHIRKVFNYEGLDVQVHYVQRIPPEASGKFKTFISRVSSAGIDTSS